jgi:hypothetical protein
MKQIMVSYKVKPEHAAENEALVRDVYKDLQHESPREGVDGSSPSEGSAKAPHVGAFSFSSTCSA